MFCRDDFEEESDAEQDYVEHCSGSWLQMIISGTFEWCDILDGKNQPENRITIILLQVSSVLDKTAAMQHETVVFPPTFNQYKMFN